MSKRNQNAKRRALDAITGRNRIPKVNLRIPRMNGGGTMVRSRFQPGTLTVTAPATAVLGNVTINPPLYTTTDAGGTVLLNYQEYRMHSGLLTYTPLVGSTTPGIVYLAYFDNPELIRNFGTGAYSVGIGLSLIKNCPNVVSAPIWQSVSLPMGMRTRRSKYSVDNTPFANNENADRTCHGIFVAGLEGTQPTLTQTFGALTLEYSAEGFGLQNSLLSGI